MELSPFGGERTLHLKNLMMMGREKNFQFSIHNFSRLSGIPQAAGQFLARMMRSCLPERFYLPKPWIGG